MLSLEISEETVKAQKAREPPSRANETWELMKLRSLEIFLFLQQSYILILFFFFFFYFFFA